MFRNFFRDKTGKVVILQTPNPALAGWFILMLANYFLQSSGVAWLVTALLFTWAYMEVFDGVNLFRRLLGLAVLLMIIVAHIR